MRVIEEAAKAAQLAFFQHAGLDGPASNWGDDGNQQIRQRWIACVEAALVVLNDPRMKMAREIKKYANMSDDDFVATMHKVAANTVFTPPLNDPTTQHWPCDVCGKDVVVGQRQCSDHLDPQPVIVEPT